MIQRKSSVRADPLSQTVTIFDYTAQQNSNLNQDDLGNELIRLGWINKKWMVEMIRISAFLSFISIMMNTPATIEQIPVVLYILFVIDLLCSAIFTVELIIKIRAKGLYRDENSYLFDRWCQFDFCMLLFHWISVLIQVHSPSVDLLIGLFPKHLLAFVFVAVRHTENQAIKIRLVNTALSTPVDTHSSHTDVHQNTFAKKSNQFNFAVSRLDQKTFRNDRVLYF
jgi:hypothetical protein